MNPFALTVGILHLTAMAWAWWHDHDWKMAVVFLCYGISQMVLAFVRMGK